MFGLDATKLEFFFVSRKKNLNLHIYQNRYGLDYSLYARAAGTKESLFPRRLFVATRPEGTSQNASRDWENL